MYYAISTEECEIQLILLQYKLFLHKKKMNITSFVCTATALNVFFWRVFFYGYCSLSHGFKPIGLMADLPAGVTATITLL